MPADMAGDPEMLLHNPLAVGAARRRATFPSKAAVIDAYTGRGAFRTWSGDQLADYVEAGFRETATGEVTLTCTPDWEASNFRTHNYDAWTAFRESRCPIRILRAENASTFRVEGHEAEIEASGRIAVETVPETSHFLPMERPDLVRKTLAEVVAL
jgi:pimeloyl-ACP methyl ester carboxylesterase